MSNIHARAEKIINTKSSITERQTQPPEATCQGGILDIFLDGKQA